MPDQEVVHTLKGGHHAAETAGNERIDAEESVAHVPVRNGRAGRLMVV